MLEQKSILSNFISFFKNISFVLNNQKIFTDCKGVDLIKKSKHIFVSWIVSEHRENNDPQQ